MAERPSNNVRIPQRNSHIIDTLVYQSHVKKSGSRQTNPEANLTRGKQLINPSTSTGERVCAMTVCARTQVEPENLVATILSCSRPPKEAGRIAS